MKDVAYTLELEHVSKHFPGVQALDDVSLKVKKGSVHVIVGENGAGKSTLMKIVNGLYKADSGTIKFDGVPIHIKDPVHARKLGVAMIFQELNYVPELTIEENLFLGREPMSKNGLWINKKLITQQTNEFIQAEGLSYDPKMKINQLSVSDIQMIEILKAVSSGASLIIMDEPTSAISRKEVEILFKKIASLKARGISIIYISHRMEEIFRIADDISVLRDGKLVYSDVASSLNKESIITHMVGRKLENIYPKEAISIGNIRLNVRDYSSEKFKNISLYVRSGEIVGLSGLMGAGRTEFARAVFGMDHHTSGVLEIDGEALEIKTPWDSIENGLVMVSEDRRKYGFVACRSIKENIALSSLKTRLNKAKLVDNRAEKQSVIQMVDLFKIKSPSIEVKIETLSGGNQQKVVLSKWFLTNPKIIIMDEPTRGIDVGAKYEIYSHITKLAKKGIAILMISSEMPELIGMCDRIYVMSMGKLTGELEAAKINQENIVKLAINS